MMVLVAFHRPRTTLFNTMFHPSCRKLLPFCKSRSLFPNMTAVSKPKIHAASLCWSNGPTPCSNSARHRTKQQFLVYSLLSQSTQIFPQPLCLHSKTFYCQLTPGRKLLFSLGFWTKQMKDIKSLEQFWCIRQRLWGMNRTNTFLLDSNSR